MKKLLWVFSPYTIRPTPKPVYYVHRVVHSLVASKPLNVYIHLFAVCKVNQCNRTSLGFGASNIRADSLVRACYSSKSFWVAIILCIFVYKNINKPHQSINYAQKAKCIMYKQTCILYLQQFQQFFSTSAPFVHQHHSIFYMMLLLIRLLC